MNTEQIEGRIQELMIERANLEQIHNASVQNNQKMNQEFQEQAVKNQTRFAQLSGAITELQQLIKPTTKGTNNNDNLPTTPDIHSRSLNVRAGKQPQNR